MLKMESAILVKEFNKRLHDNISITHQMGIQVVAYDRFSIGLSAPILSNRNDKRTAFAGSIYSACVLTGWSLATLIMEEADMPSDVLVYESWIKNYSPVHGDIITRSRPLSRDTHRNFIEEYMANGKAKLAVSVLIEDDEKTLVEFAGKYMARPRAASAPSGSVSWDQGRSSQR